ncbi:MAG TPA: hemolysin III family protein [Solimonas sp.]
MSSAPVNAAEPRGLGHGHHDIAGLPVPEKLYTLGEEVAHAITHGLGVVLSIAGLAVLVARASLYGDAWHIVAVSIFGATLVLMYTASTLYHSIPLPRAKHVLRVIDHSLIYFLIAGTYTPFTLVTLRGPWGWSLFGLTWGLAIAGVIFKIFATGRFEKVSLAIYLGMGWCAIAAIQPLLQNLEPGGLALMLAGGLSYSGGVAFYVWRRLRYHHAIWHLFVLIGSVLHYFAILFYVVPGPPG